MGILNCNLFIMAILYLSSGPYIVFFIVALYSRFYCTCTSHIRKVYTKQGKGNIFSTIIYLHSNLKLDVELSFLEKECWHLHVWVYYF